MEDYIETKTNKPFDTKTNMYMTNSNKEYECIINKTMRSNSPYNSDVEMNSIEKLQPKITEPEVDNYYTWMLQKVMGSIPDIDINKKEDKDSSFDRDSINDYNNQTIINYFNSFD
jgi:hypothetical protein